MNRSEVISVFDAYVDKYDRDNPMIFQKAAHSYRVAAIAERIARSLGQEELVDFAWLLGLLHDIGRFGADILFKEGLINRFPAEPLPEGWQNIAEIAIRQHNKLTLPEDLDENTRTLSDILRDADKVDIFRVLTEISYSDRNGGRKSFHSDSHELSPEVMNCVLEHRCVPSMIRKTYFDKRVSHCCLAFELAYEESRVITREQGYLRRLLTMQDEDGQCIRNDKMLHQLALVEREIENAWQAASR